MKKFIIIILSLSNTFLFAQTEQRSIELPDFVITGKQSVQIPVAVKKKPDFVSTISQEYLTPQYTPEELPILISSNPVPFTPDIKTVNEYFNASLKVQVGKYTWPAGEFNLNKSLGNYLFNVKVWGSNIKDYIDYAGYNNSGVSTNNELFFSTKSDFLPGAKVKFGADYSRDSYHLYGSDNPSFLRETNNINANVSISSSYSRWINFAFGVSGNSMSFKENDSKETNIKTNGLFEFKLNNYSLGVKGLFNKQMLDNLYQNGNGNFVSLDGFFKGTPVSTFRWTAGVVYASGLSDNLFSPYGSIELLLDKGFTLYAEYKPHAQLFGITDFLKKNPYFMLETFDNVFSKYKIDFKSILKYEYQKMFNVSATMNYSKVSNYFYFGDMAHITPGDLLLSNKLSLHVLSEAEIVSGGLNFTYYPSLYGNIAVDVLYKSAKDNAGNHIPYEPQITSILGYGYDFQFGLGFNIKYKLAMDTYTDFGNSYKLSDYHSISLFLDYEFFKGLKLTADFQNILNRTNFTWKQYQEKPFDVLIGIEYCW
jgi:hypothetical protein